jgi:A1 cistron-splicing factor AAR2
LSTPAKEGSDSNNMSLLSPTPTLLVPHLPAKTLVGIDLITFTSTENFHGIKDIAQGWHFLYTGTTESFSLRCGAWFYIGDISAIEDKNNAGQEDENRIVRAAARGLHDGNMQSEIRIWKWDQNIEALVPLKGETADDRQETMRYKANLGAIWQSGGLFKYRTRLPPSSSRKQQGDAEKGTHDDDQDGEEDEEGGRREWIALTDRLSPQLLSRVLDDPDLDIDGRPAWTVTSASTAAQDADRIPGLTADEFTKGGVAGEQEKELRFLPVDLKRTWREGAVGRERTEAAQDRSWALGELIRRYSEPSSDDRVGEKQILGELQFTFLMVLTLMNYSCLEQWKRLLNLIFTCRSAIRTREIFFRDVLRLLLLQLKHCEIVEGGLFEMDGDQGGAFLRKLLMGFHKSMEEVLDGVAGSTVRAEMDALEKWLQVEFGWELRKEAIMRRGMLQLEDGEQVEMTMIGADEEDEMGEYAPLVVDLGDNEAVVEADVDMDDSNPRM